MLPVERPLTISDDQVSHEYFPLDRVRKEPTTTRRMTAIRNDHRKAAIANSVIRSTALVRINCPSADGGRTSHPRRDWLWDRPGGGGRPIRCRAEPRRDPGRPCGQGCATTSARPVLPEATRRPSHEPRSGTSR